MNMTGLMKSIRNIMREDNGVNGDAQRIRLQKDKFFNQEIPRPTMENQKHLLKRFSDCNELEQPIGQSKSAPANFKQFLLAEAFGESV